MGNGYSGRNTNLGVNCPYFDSSTTGTTARWGDSLEVSMCKYWDKDESEVWCVGYKIGKKLEHGCGFSLRAKHDNSGVESIYFSLGDDNDIMSGFSLDITRVGRDGLHGGIRGVTTSGIYKSSISVKQDYSIETTIVSYGNSYSDTLFVLQMKKRKNHENACMVTMAHYYVTKDVGLSAAAKIYLSKGKGFVVEVKGPFKHPSDDLRRVISETCRTGIWCPAAKSSYTKQQDCSSSLENNGMVSQFVNHASSSNKGLINSNGYTKGALNHSIFQNCKFS
ncbi:hypothetical protein RYX36_002200 [Vicia faba]